MLGVICKSFNTFFLRILRQKSCQVLFITSFPTVILTTVILTIIISENVIFRYNHFRKNMIFPQNPTHNGCILLQTYSSLSNGLKE